MFGAGSDKLAPWCLCKAQSELFIFISAVKVSQLFACLQGPHPPAVTSAHTSGDQIHPLIQPP